MPLYATVEDKKTEKDVRERLIELGWDAQITEGLQRWDIEATMGTLSLVVEVKRRRMDWGTFPTIFIDKTKVDAILKRAVEIHAYPIFVVVANDGIERYVPLNYPDKWATNDMAVRPDRKDRFDANDVKYEIPVEEFLTL